MVAIVNNKSASAAEIFAGAMQDNKRAIIIGNSTYGKGSIQEVIPLKSGGAVILTTAKYFRPSGEPITQGGIRPDIKIQNNNCLVMVDYIRKTSDINVKENEKKISELLSKLEKTEDQIIRDNLMMDIDLIRSENQASDKAKG